MRMINRIASLCVVGVLALSAGGCATQFGERLSSVASTISSAKVDPTSIIVASNAFDAVQATATNYLRLKRCTGSNGPVCRDSRATKPLISAVKAGRVARDAAQDFVRAHPGELGPQGIYDALVEATGTVQQIFTIYKVEEVAR